MPMRPALFLDRDGVINVEKGYVFRIADIEWVDGIFDLCHWFQERSFLLVGITNQAGVARGLYTEAHVEELHHWLKEQFHQRGLELAKIFYCPHHPTAGQPPYRRDCDCRKPRPGMILQAREAFGIDLAGSVLIGDRESDIEAGLNAGIPTTALIRGGGAAAAPTRARIVVGRLAELMRPELLPGS
jgi:D-glycero-D-manno-heptose 1,7-bisphosphate phosphatase